MLVDDDNYLGVYNGLSDLHAFIFRFRNCRLNCVDYYKCDGEKQFFQLKNALFDSSEYTVTETGAGATTHGINDLLRLRFGNKNNRKDFV